MGVEDAEHPAAFDILVAVAGVSHMISSSVSQGHCYGILPVYLGTFFLQFQLFVIFFFSSGTPKFCRAEIAKDNWDFCVAATLQAVGRR